MEESKRYIEEFKYTFDYNVEESFNTDYEKAPYAKSAAELTDRWRKQIKLSTPLQRAFKKRKQK
jgi:carboxyl-terminal processing protease